MRPDEEGSGTATPPPSESEGSSFDAIVAAFSDVSNALDGLTQEDKARVLNAAGCLHGLFPILDTHSTKASS